MDRWYRLIRTRCPTCGQALAVEAGQVARREVVTCQDCNSDLRLLPPGAEAPDTAPGSDEPAPIPLYTPV